MKLTIKDIAKLSGVGISTVSRVLNEKSDVGEATRQKVLKIVKEYDYSPNANAKHLKQKGSDYIAVIIRGMRNIFLSGIAEELQNYIEASGFHFLLSYIDERSDEFEAARKIQNEKKVRGIIFLGGDPVKKADSLSQLGVPCVLSTVSAAKVGLGNVSSVSVDDRSAARNAVDYLISKGHRQIAVLGGELEEENAIRLRYDGACDSFFAAGIKFDDSLYLTSNFSPDSAYKAVSKALNENKSFTAIFAMSDTMAMGAIRAICDFGLKVPRDISVMGFDGIEIGQYYSPVLTTVKQPVDRLARISVELLVENMQPEQKSRHLLLETSIIEGQSVAQIN